MVHFLLFVFFGALLGAIGSTVGGASLVSVPLLVATGLSPLGAIATSKFAVLASFITGGVRYSKEGVLQDKKLAIILSIPALLGSVAGSLLVLRVNQAVLLKVIIVLLVIVFGFTLFKKDIGSSAKHTHITKSKRILGVLVMLILGVYAGFFGAGFGSFAILSLIYLFGYSFLESSAFMTVINFFALLAATAVFIGHNTINYYDGWPLLLGSALGGWVGVKYAVLKGNVWLRRAFLLITAGLIIDLIIKG